MQRAPLKDLQADTVTMSGEQMVKRTPEKCRDQAAATAAAKLLNSAKKSATKQCAKKAKLSLQKISSGTAPAKSSARALALECDLNDTIEFKTSVSMKSMPKLQLATRKRKKTPLQDDHGKKAKTERQEICSSKTEQITETARILDADQNCTDVKPCSSHHSIWGPKLHTNPPYLPRDTEASSSRLSTTGNMAEDESETDSQCERNLSTSLHTCPACGKMLRRGMFVRHIKICLSQHCDDEDQVSNEVLPGGTSDPSSDHTHPVKQEDRSSVNNETESLQTDYIYCQLCQKDLSHLNSHRRRLHINRCIDEEEKRKKEMEERQRALEDAKTQVLDCPMCGKVLRTAQSRKIHLKKCATSLGVEPEQLLAAVKRQEEEHRATLAAGILPVRPGRSGRQNSTSTKRGMGSLPKSKLDEDTQLALALSSSLRSDAEGPGTSAATGRGRGRKNKQEEDYLLLKLTESQSAGRIEARVSHLITMEEEDEEEVIPPLPKFNQQSLPGQTVQWSTDKALAQCKMFWRLSSLEEPSGEGEGSSGDSLQYYVSALMPPVQVSTVVAGSKIRRMSEIPGRRRSLDSQATEKAVSCDEQVNDEDEGHEDGSLPPFSTQTAALLADMAAEADGFEQSSPLSSAPSEISDIEQHIHHDLLSAFSSLVNRQEFSDVVIQAAGSSLLHAHRVILSVRCPALLQLVDTETGVIDLCDWPSQCVLAVLRFLYAGDTQLDQCCLPATLQLAHRLGLASLAQICRGQLEPDSPAKVVSGRTEESKQLNQSSDSASVRNQNVGTEVGNRKNMAASAPSEEGDDRREDGPPVLECYSHEPSPPDIELMETVSPRQHSIPDVQQLAQHQPEPQTNEMTQKDPGIISHDCKTQTPQKLFEPESRAKDDSVGKVHEVTGNEEDFAKQQVNAVMEASGTDDDGDVSIDIVSADSSGRSDSYNTLQNSRSPSAACSEGVDGFLSCQKQKGSEHQQESDNFGVQGKERAGENNMQKKSSQAKVSISPQSVEPVDSIEISDDDLFSSDDNDVLLDFSSPPSQGEKQNSKGKDQSEGHGASSQDGKEQSHVSSASESKQKTASIHSGKTFHGKSCGWKDDRYGGTRTENANHPLADQQREQQRCRQQLSQDRLSSVSMSVREYSYTHISGSSLKHGQFQTSTPHLHSESGLTQRTVNKEKLKDKRGIQDTSSNHLRGSLGTTTSPKTQTPFVQNKDSMNLSDSSDGEKDIVCSQRKKQQTPCLSVVEQDSLYVTPCVEESNMRKTFQLVTPLPLEAGARSSPRTPVSHHTPKKSTFVESNTSPDAGAGDTNKRKELHKETHSIAHLPRHSCHQKRLSSQKIFPQPDPQKAEDSHIGADDSDSDLEIIDTSVQVASSPKFSQSRLSCSQPQSQSQSVCRSITLSSPHNQPGPSPKKDAHSNLTSKAAPSYRQHSEHRSEYRSRSRPCHSPAKVSPSSSWDRFSQRSADSDKELLRVTELVCREAEHDQLVTSGKGGAESPCDVDALDASGSAEDVWEGFDNLDDYNPDLFLDVQEKIDNSGSNPESHSIKKSCSPYRSPRPSSASPFKAPAESPKKSEVISPRSKVSIASDVTVTPKSSLKQTVSKKTYKEQEGSDKLKSTKVTASSSSTTVCNKLEPCTSYAKARDRTGELPGLLMGVGDGLLLADEDTEAANSSFLWSEENAPTEDSVLVEDEAYKQVALELGREETVLSQEPERPLAKTPTQPKQRKKGGKSAVIPPSPFTPMLPYDDMNTPQLKNEVQKYGLKPVGKKRMKLVLKDIYHKTHQYETDSDYDEDSSYLPNLDPPVLSKEGGQALTAWQAPVLHRESNRPRSRPPVDQSRPPPMLCKEKEKGQGCSHTARQNRKLPVLDRESGPSQDLGTVPGLSKPGKRPKTKRGLAQNVTEPSEDQSRTTAAQQQQQSQEPERRIHLELPAVSSYQSPKKSRCGVGALQRRVHNESPTKTATASNSSPEKGISSSQDSDASEQPDVSVFEERLDSDDNEEITPSQQIAAADLPQKLMAFIRSNPDLHHKVLTFEPLDLGMLKEDLKAAGIRCSQQKLLDFLDEKCITFTTKNMVPRKQRRRGRKPQSRKITASQK
ncbi:uncharacterized protein LOC143283970 [Babylonia areolata]|uniref:uncharacterized protein LOC143283970 n=1 Tax=Babylonia areolata TaxID=304850 RepID=UPI003FD2F419